MARPSWVRNAELARAVARGLDRGLRQRRPAGGRAASASRIGRGDVGHRLQRLDALAVQPAEDLLGAIAGRARGRGPAGQLVRQQRAQIARCRERGRRPKRGQGVGGGHGGGRIHHHRACRASPTAAPAVLRAVMRSVVRLGLMAVVVATAAGWGMRGRPGPPAEPGPPTFSVAGGRLRLEVCADDIVRVAFARDDAFFTRPSLMAAPRKCTPSAWKLTKTDGKARRSRPAASPSRSSPCRPSSSASRPRACTSWAPPSATAA